jgi:hypothetical protein
VLLCLVGPLRSPLLDHPHCPLDRAESGQSQICNAGGSQQNSPPARCYGEVFGLSPFLFSFTRTPPLILPAPASRPNAVKVYRGPMKNGKRPKEEAAKGPSDEKGRRPKPRQSWARGRGWPGWHQKSALGEGPVSTDHQDEG